MKTFGPKASILGLLAVILPVGFALAQGGALPGSGAAAPPNGMPGVGAPPSTNATPPPPITGQSAPPAPTTVQGIAEEAPSSTVGLSQPAPDGSTKIVPARRCSTAARETDGTTTCIGIPAHGIPR